MTTPTIDPDVPKGYALRLPSSLYLHLQTQASQQGESMNTHLHRLLASASAFASDSHSDGDLLDARTRHSPAEAFLVLAQLSYRADVTRHSPPAISRLRELYDGGDRLSDVRVAEVVAWTDRRIAQAAARRLRDEW